MPDEFVAIVEIPVRPATGTDRSLLLSTLSALAAGDARFQFVPNDGTGDVMLAGIDEPQLEQTIEALRRLGVDISVGAPQAACRETLMRRATVAYSHKKQFAGGGEYARVKLVLDPSGPESGYACEFRTSGTHLPDEYMAGVRSGVEGALRFGVVAGFPVIGVTATVVDGAFHEIDSSFTAFAIAARGAVRDALRSGDAVVLEPVVKAETVTPADCVGPVMADLTRRHADILDRDIRDDRTVIVATITATNLLGYAKALRSISGGRATYRVQFDHYAPVSPPDDPRFRPAAAMRA